MSEPSRFGRSGFRTKPRPAERRTHARYACRSASILQPLANRKAEVWRSVQVENVSTKGLGLVCDLSIERGALLCVKLQGAAARSPGRCWCAWCASARDRAASGASAAPLPFRSARRNSAPSCGQGKHPPHPRAKCTLLRRVNRSRRPRWHTTHLSMAAYASAGVATVAAFRSRWYSLLARVSEPRWSAGRRWLPEWAQAGLVQSVPARHDPSRTQHESVSDRSID